AAPPPDPAVRAAVRAPVAARGARVGERLAADVGLSTRQLQRRFGRAVGLTPKEFARVRRVRSAIGAVLAREVAWSQLAAEYGWADQAHMVRDMAAVTGLTPAQLEARLAQIAHGAVTP
ncbi:helix-turn-helix domain-containing protein, partial [Roseisolibacter sp. H3M3-2]|uniref:helix-turn-helix domain-containing protein n=1 Tax=Roseisolibacter sp. H3M3-2 TaxID=3031323 RepID=UPI0023DACE08